MQCKSRRGPGADDRAEHLSSKSSCLHSIKLYATTSVNRKKALALNGEISSPVISALCSGTVCSAISSEFSIVWIAHLIVSSTLCKLRQVE